MRALISGSSGLVGGELLERLMKSASIERVVSVGRRPVSVGDGDPASKLTQMNVDFANLPELPPTDVAFCCLGTTIKKAGSQAAFRAVDHDAVIAFARAAKKAGAKKFVLVSALGANAKSPIFYNRVKGEVERDLTGVGFDSLIILRPSLLLGERKESRAAEKVFVRLAPLVTPLLIGPLTNYRPIEGARVASAMLAKATGRTEPLEIIEGCDILRIAGSQE